MSNWKILHNPKCSKSREVLKLLQEKGIKPQVIEYLKTPLTSKEIQALLKQIDTEPSSLVRAKEDLYKELKFDLNSEAEIIKALEKHPGLMERPVVIKDNKAVIARPTEKINQLF